MDDQRPFDALTHEERRALLQQTVARIVGVVVGLFVLYAVVPLPVRVGIGTVAALAAGLAALVVVIVFQVRAIMVAVRPGLRAIEALALSVAVLVVVFAYVYASLSAGAPGSFTEPLSRLDGVYFAVTVLSTVGFGDIAARTDAARLIVTLQIATDLLIVAGLARLLATVVRQSMARAH